MIEYKTIEFLRKEFFFKGKMYSVCAMDKKTLNEELRKLRDKVVLDYQEYRRQLNEQRLKQNGLNYRRMFVKYFNSKPGMAARMRLNGVDMSWVNKNQFDVIDNERRHIDNLMTRMDFMGPDF